MNMKINKACDLSSISVLPPQSRRSNVVHSGPESSSVFGRSRTTSDLRSQQMKLQYSQPSLSQGIASQKGILSQFSQSSQDEILINEKISSQERENSVPRTSCLPQFNYTREESQMSMPRSSSKLVRKWSGPEHKRQNSEEFEHRIGILETSLNRIGMILDSVQSDIMLVNRGTKEVALEMEGMRQKLIILDSTLQSLNKGQEDIKTRLDLGFRSVSENRQQNGNNQENYAKISSMLLALSEKFDIQEEKIQSIVSENFRKEMQAVPSNMKSFRRTWETTPVCVSKSASGPSSLLEVLVPTDAAMHSNVQRSTLIPKGKMGGWTSIKHEQTTAKVGNLGPKTHQVQEWRVIIDSDEEIDGGFSCLLKENGADKEKYLFEEAQEETARILRRARRRKRKYSNAFKIN